MPAIHLPPHPPVRPIVHPQQTRLPSSQQIVDSILQTHQRTHGAHSGQFPSISSPGSGRFQYWPKHDPFLNAYQFRENLMRKLTESQRAPETYDNNSRQHDPSIKIEVPDEYEHNGRKREKDPVTFADDFRVMVGPTFQLHVCPGFDEKNRELLRTHESNDSLALQNFVRRRRQNDDPCKAQ